MASSRHTRASQQPRQPGARTGMTWRQVRRQVEVEALTLALALRLNLTLTLSLTLTLTLRLAWADGGDEGPGGERVVVGQLETHARLGCG